MTDEEREKLAAKLDKDLDDFIGGLEKRSYSEGWPEDKWQEVCIYLLQLAHVWYSSLLSKMCKARVLNLF